MMNFSPFVLCTKCLFIKDGYEIIRKLTFASTFCLRNVIKFIRVRSVEILNIDKN
jgi:hypothetical protein